MGYVFPPGQEPLDPPPGIRVGDLRRPITALDDGTRERLEIPAFLRRANGEKLNRELLAKAGIVVEGASSSTFNVQQAALQLAVLSTAFQEASEYDPIRHHNQPPPALWVDNKNYLEDLRSLLEELRRLNELLEKSANPIKPEGGASIAILAGKKFVESYVDVMGKGAAALTIGGVAALFVSLGVDQGSVKAVWNLLKASK